MRNEQEIRQEIKEAKDQCEKDIKGNIAKTEIALDQTWIAALEWVITGKEDNPHDRDRKKKELQAEAILNRVGSIEILLRQIRNDVDIILGKGGSQVI